MNLKMIIIVLGISIGLGCQMKPADEVVLEIGGYMLRSTELDYLTAIDTYKALSPTQLQDRLLEEGKILAYAIDQKYDTITILQKQLHYASRYYASKVNGYVWNKKVKPLLHIGENDIQKVFLDRYPDHHSNARADDYSKQRSDIRKELLSKMTQKFIIESQQRILKETKSKMNDNAIKELAVKFDAERQDWPNLNRALRLMDYVFDNKHYVFTVSDFIEFVRSQPIFFGSLKKPEDLKDMMRTFLIDKSLYAEAVEMGMEKDQTYLAFKNYYQHQLFLHHYRRELIYSKIIIQEQELDDYYRNHSNELKNFQSAIIKVFKFRELSSALECQQRILLSYKNPNLPKETKLNNGSIPQPELLTVQMSDTKVHPNVIEAISKLSEGQLSGPVETDSGYWIFYLSVKKGIAQIPYQYAKEGIRKLLYENKVQQLYTSNISKLEGIYHIKQNRLKEIQSNHNIISLLLNIFNPKL